MDRLLRHLFHSCARLHCRPHSAHPRIDGWANRCRYCQRRYASPEHRGFLDRTCYRRACRRQYERYRVALDQADKAVRQRWQAKTGGVLTLTAETWDQWEEELTDARKAIDRRYGGEPEGRRDE